MSDNPPAQRSASDSINQKVLRKCARLAGEEYRKRFKKRIILPGTDDIDLIHCWNTTEIQPNECSPDGTYLVQLLVKNEKTTKAGTYHPLYLYSVSITTKHYRAICDKIARLDAMPMTLIGKTPDLTLHGSPAPDTLPDHFPLDDCEKHSPPETLSAFTTDLRKAFSAYLKKHNAEPVITIQPDDPTSTHWVSFSFLTKRHPVGGIVYCNKRGSLKWNYIAQEAWVNMILDKENEAAKKPETEIVFSFDAICRHAVQDLMTMGLSNEDAETFMEKFAENLKNAALRKLSQKCTGDKP